MMTDLRNRWERGLIRHLRLDPDCPLDKAYALRSDLEICYTLSINPKWADRAEDFRMRFEVCPSLGGPFSPERDLSG